MRFLARVEDESNSTVVGICMGEPGIISRVLGVRAGSAFTFASASEGEETASGQIAARTLLETYRVDQVDAATKIYGVAGNPIHSSLSPLMMNTAFRRETVNAVYLGLQTSKADDLFKLAREVPIQGLSITMPLKQDVMPLLERTDQLSAKIGAVNTILRAQDGKFYGFNTDVAGIVTPLERRLTLKNAKILVLGAGGAARAAVFGCCDKGAEVFILNRTHETAQKLARQSGAKAIRRDAVAKTHFDVIINTTPIGMAGNTSKNTPASPLEAAELNARYVFDLVYNPIETPLLRLARQKGIAVITGVEMFVQQGARQFEIWTGKPAKPPRKQKHRRQPVRPPRRRPKLLRHPPHQRQSTCRQPQCRPNLHRPRSRRSRPLRQRRQPGKRLRQTCQPGKPPRRNPRRGRPSQKRPSSRTGSCPRHAKRRPRPGLFSLAESPTFKLLANPPLQGRHADLAAEEGLHQLARRLRPARFEHLAPVAHRHRAFNQILLIELREELQRHHLVV
jgi:shikimate dehydrogenase